MKTLTARQSNIELLRILAMLGVVLLHVNNDDIGRGLVLAQGWNRSILLAVECFCACAVDLFVLISGYFLSRNNRRQIMKPLQLITQVILFNLAFYAVNVILKRAGLSLWEIVRAFLPVNYFVMLYAALYFLSPFLNMMIAKARESGNVRTLAVVFLAVLSVYPFLVDLLQAKMQAEFQGLSTIGLYGSQNGYTLIQFVLMYILGAVLAEADLSKISRSKCLFGAIGCPLLVIACYYLLARFRMRPTLAWSYCNPLVILCSVCYFLVFVRMQFTSRIVNSLASAAFTVYLLHAPMLRFIDLSRIFRLNGALMLLCLLLCAVCIYLICWVISLIYQYVMRRVFRLLAGAVPLLTREIIR